MSATRRGYAPCARPRPPSTPWCSRTHGRLRVSSTVCESGPGGEVEGGGQMWFLTFALLVHLAVPVRNLGLLGVKDSLLAQRLLGHHQAGVQAKAEGTSRPRLIHLSRRRQDDGCVTRMEGRAQTTGAGVVTHQRVVRAPEAQLQQQGQAQASWCAQTTCGGGHRRVGANGAEQGGRAGGSHRGGQEVGGCLRVWWKQLNTPGD